MGYAELRRPERTYTIRNLCVEFKVTPRALRFYEDKGLLSPRRQGLNRIYTYRDRARLQLILQGKRVGLSLAEIREILELYDKRDGGAAQLQKSLEKYRERIVALREQRIDIDEAIETLEKACEWAEGRLKELRPEALPQAEAYQGRMLERLDA
jgi:DNA-binding transcriptional MerR regulator